jgi:pantothenate kinase
VPITLNGVEQALARANEITKKTDKRVIIGVVGKPGAGKSTLTSYLIDHLPKNSVSLVPMDGYHLSNQQLSRLDLANKKGAFNTFDADGYIALLKRINNEFDKDIYFPVFHREIEESYSADGVVPARTKLILTEGNYLLFDQAGWENVISELTETWYINIEDKLRIDRLVKRHEFYGKSKEAAIAWANASDETNAKIVEATSIRADVVINI